MPGLEQAVKAQDVGRVDEARAHLTSRCGGWCLGRKSDEARRQCTWIRSRKQVLSSKVSMICCLWLVLILADQGSAESLVLMAWLNHEYYCCTFTNTYLPSYLYKTIQAPSWWQISIKTEVNNITETRHSPSNPNLNQRSTKIQGVS